MAVGGPSGRTYTIDDNGGTPRDMSALIVGEPGGVGELEEALHDLTGPSATAPLILPAGFTRGSDITFEFQNDVGGSSPADPSAIFHVARGTSRTITIVYASGHTFASESYISKVTPKTPPEKLNTLAVTFRLTGAQTVT